MRRLCLTVGMCAMLAMPALAQQGKDEAKLSGESTSVAAAANDNGRDVATPAPAPTVTKPAPRNLFAMPAAPKATPFPGPTASPADNSSGDQPPGRLVPKYELAAMFSYIALHPGDP